MGIEPCYALGWRRRAAGFEIVYVFDGVVRKYRPDFLVRLGSGTMLVLEVKGQDTPQHQAKRAALDEWARAVILTT